MKTRSSVWALACVSSILLVSPTLASFHLWEISEIYSNSDGTIQYIELFTSSNSQQFTTNRVIRASQGASSNEFMFPSNTPFPTSGHHLLLATSGFSSLPGAVTPDYTLDDGFLFTPDGVVNFVGANSLTYASLPTDGIMSVHCDSNSGSSCTATSIGDNSPTNYAGATGFIDASGSDCMDTDSDGYGSPGDAACPGGAEQDCDDTNGSINPGATESCDDGVDNDCDELTDEADPDCDSDIVPAMSEWGLVVMLLLLLTAGTIACGSKAWRLSVE